MITKDWNEYVKTARTAIAEGCILLENNQMGLPLQKGAVVSVFGRIARHYYKSGTGSGGMVNVDEVIGITEGLKRGENVTIYEKLEQVYAEWEEKNPLDQGFGWGQEPWSQKEMPLEDDLVLDCSKHSDVALVIIGRTAGEDKDQSETPGSYLLTDLEEEMLAKVRKYFDRMVVVLNIGGLVDFSFIDRHHPDSVLLAWQGGMIGGLGVADVLTGIVPPSGHLTDTIADIKDYPSTACFGSKEKNFYKEDIYVGYRYFETFRKEAVRYPFGYGLGYTTFAEELISCKTELGSIPKTTLIVKVTNTGSSIGKCVEMAFVSAPNGMLGKALTLGGFAKTSMLAPGEAEEVEIVIDAREYSSYDDSGVTGHLAAFVLEAGEYTVSYGMNARNITVADTFTLPEFVVLEQLSTTALGPVEPFERMKRMADGSVGFEAVPTLDVEAEAARVLDNIPEEFAKSDKTNLKLVDVETGNCTVEELVADLSVEELCSIVRGEGMGSAQVTPGTASAFCGVSPKLKERMLPAICCDDGPSGMRLDSGVHAFSLPIGTMLASSFNTALVEQLYSFVSAEMVGNKVEVLLGPGMNIHRHPLNGRNFEYFSEDPLVTALMAEAVLRGLNTYGVCGCVKHFCGNNQETNRYGSNSIISERALREIYLRPFERALKADVTAAVMTTYGPVNGVWTSSSYDLNTVILREQWGFQGIVMTDWWADINRRGMAPDRRDFAAMVRAQNDMYMCCRDSSINSSDDNLETALADGRLTLAELQRTAKNVISFALYNRAYERIKGIVTKVEWQNKPKSVDDVNPEDVEIILAREGEDVCVDLTVKESKEGTNYLYLIDFGTNGQFDVTLTGSSGMSRVAQIPVTLYSNGTPVVTFSFKGSENQDVAITQNIKIMNPKPILRLYVARPGVELKSIRFEYTGPLQFEM